MTQEEWINGEKVTVGTFKIPLPAALGNVGKYYYRLIMKNNAYYGSDVDVPVDLEVVPPSQEKSLAGVKKLMEKKKKSENLDSDEEEEEEDSDSDISDPEEDSLAGALAALRGEATSKKSDKIEEVDDEEDEDVFTDINTDTEDEAD